MTYRLFSVPMDQTAKPGSAFREKPCRDVVRTVFELNGGLGRVDTCQNSSVTYIGMRDERNRFSAMRPLVESTQGCRDTDPM